MRPTTLATLLMLSTSLPAAAQSIQDRVVQQLSDQGFEIVQMKRTLLGRVRIEAQGDGLERELVFNPNTGEILRDYWVASEDEGDDVGEDEDDGDEDDGFRILRAFGFGGDALEDEDDLEEVDLEDEDDEEEDDEDDEDDDDEDGSDDGDDGDEGDDDD